MNPGLLRFLMLTSVVRMAANRGQHWSDVEVNALLDIWADDKIQTLGMCTH